MLRGQGSLYDYNKEQGIVKNIYTLSIINKTVEEFDDIYIRLESHKGDLKLVNASASIPKQGILKGTVIVSIPKDQLYEMSSEIEIGVYYKGKRIAGDKTNFFAPF